MDSRSPRGGKVVDTLGHYTPYMKNKPLEVDLDRVQEWHKKGAIPSDAVNRLLKRARRTNGAVDVPPEDRKAVRIEAEPTVTAVEETAQAEAEPTVTAVDCNCG